MLQGSSGLALYIAKILFVSIRILVSVGKWSKTFQRYICFTLITSQADIKYMGSSLPIFVAVYSWTYEPYISERPQHGHVIHILIFQLRYSLRHPPNFCFHSL